MNLLVLSLLIASVGSARSVNRVGASNPSVGSESSEAAIGPNPLPLGPSEAGRNLEQASASFDLIDRLEPASRPTGHADRKQASNSGTGSSGGPANAGIRATKGGHFGSLARSLAGLLASSIRLLIACSGSRFRPNQVHNRSHL